MKDVVRGHTQQEAVNQSPAASGEQIIDTYYAEISVPTLTPSQVRENTPSLGPLECGKCGRKFFAMTMLPTLSRLNRRTGVCPFEDCEEPFQIAVEEAPPSPRTPKKLPLVKKGRYA